MSLPSDKSNLGDSVPPGDSDPPNTNHESLAPLHKLIGLVVAMWILYAGALWFGVDEPDDRGLFGDMFGGINALFSALAFAALIFTVLLQRRELSLQRLELSETRKEIKGQREQMELQNKTLRIQAFEGTFFHLLNLHHSLVAAITMTAGGDVYAGRAAFDGFYKRIGWMYQDDSDREAVEERSEIDRAYLDAYTPHQAQFGHYFRNLYHIIKLIHRSDVEDKRQYTNLVRAQLSSSELLCLFYNCLSQHGTEKFQPLVERYTLLKNMPMEELIRQDHSRYYERTAFFTR
jgi:hypothetical protein